MVSTLQSLWRGELPLATAFWVYAVTYSLLLNLLFSGLGLVLYLNFDMALAALIAHLAPLVYVIVAAVGTWRSADRHGVATATAWLAKAGLVLVFALMILV